MIGSVYLGVVWLISPFMEKAKLDEGVASFARTNILQRLNIDLGTDQQNNIMVQLWWALRRGYIKPKSDI